MNRAKFNTLILPLTDSLYRMAKSILQDADEANDTVQDLLLKLWEIRKELSDIDNVTGFAFRSMRNRCLDIIRKRKNQSEFVEEQLYDAPNPYEQTEQRDMVRHVYQLIEKLPELQRTIIRMRDVEEMEIAEIAYITEISENAVSVNLSRARQRVREQMKSELIREEEKRWTE